ncbi:endonuclease domain-containing protein [Streptomyces yaizuensis]|uniref:Endonuclease domain-containing protein n=1 Tax=Streptomyces yaizuensis TaxID=2989713 RepID=A0ABQ5P648_9ACTN|nr:endonuclease domain-containing protein [Streptomyces sp. YSPA8]GLF98034.1 endonuclease domain-containing protein [Streptomyces sp. YSPA8]
MEQELITLQDFPGHRRAALVGRSPSGAEIREIEAGLNEARGRIGASCSVTWPARGVDAVAWEGDDGRWHLRLGDRMLCTGHRDWGRSGAPAPAPQGSAIAHRREYHAFTDGVNFRIDLRGAVGDPDAWKYLEGVGVWEVELTGEESRPELIAPRMRCPVNAYYGDWGSYADPKQWKGRIRNYLTPLIGPGCHGCGRSPGVSIDHDHATGLVRGFLCVYCNTHIDSCPHPAGCEWAEYLNAPPALPYGRKYLDRTHEKRKAARTRPGDGQPAGGLAASTALGRTVRRPR